MFIFFKFRDLEDNIWPVYKTTQHKAIINAIDGVSGTNSGCGAPEIVTGSRDGKFLRSIGTRRFLILLYVYHVIRQVKTVIWIIY